MRARQVHHPRHGRAAAERVEAGASRSCDVDDPGTAAGAAAAGSREGGRGADQADDDPHEQHDRRRAGRR